MADRAGSARSSITSTPSGAVVACLVVIWAAFGLLPSWTRRWRLKAGFVVGVFLGAASCSGRPWTPRCPTPALRPPEARLRRSRAPGTRSAATCTGRRTSGQRALRHRARPRPQRRHAPRLHGRGRRGDPRQARPLRRRDAPGARDDRSASTPATGRVTRDELDEARRQGARLAARRRALIRLKFKDPADIAKIDDRFPKKFLAELVADAGARRRRGHLQDPRGGRVADPRARRRPGEGDRQPPRRRARPARGERHHARRGHHRRGPRQGREELRRHQGDHPPDGAPRVQDGRRRRRDFFGKHQGRRAPRRRGHRDLPGERARRLDARHKTVADATSRACRASRRSTERDDERVPRALQGVDARRSTSPTITRSASRRSPSRRRPTPLQVERDRLAHALPLRARRGDRRLHHRRAASRQDQQNGVGQLLRRASRSAPRAPTASRRSPARTSSAASRSSSTTSSTRRRSSSRRSAAATRSITHGRGRPGAAAARRASKLELVLRSGALPAPITPSRTSRSSARRSGATRSRKGVEGRRSSASASCSLFMVALLPEVRRRRRRRGALQPAAPARGPRDASARR